MTADFPVSCTGATDREVEARCTEEHCGPMCDQVMAERDHYCDVADQLASLLAPPEVLGEHSSMNDPWQNAIDHAEAQHAKAARAAAAPDSGAALIAAERARQVEQEGWTPEHDAEHADDAMAQAAASYAMPARFRPINDAPFLWPWHFGGWKPTPDDRVRELVKAGALIAAEIDRLRAAALLAEQPGGGR